VSEYADQMTEMLIEERPYRSADQKKVDVEEQEV
jgi:hypothetical protein